MKKKLSFYGTTVSFLLMFILSLPVRGRSPEELAVNNSRFIINNGQLSDIQGNPRPDLLFFSEVNGMNIYLRKNALSYVLFREEETEAASQKNQEEGYFNDSFSFHKKNESLIKGHRVDLEFVGSNTDATFETLEASTEFYNYYTPVCPSGITNVHSYGKIKYSDIYPLTDIVFYGHSQKGFKYDFIVKPGGNPDDITLNYSGQDKIEIENGKLKIHTSIGELGEWMPRVYQIISGKIIDIETAYVEEGGHVKIKVGKYDPQANLIIDPWITYLGGSGNEAGNSIDANASGCVVVGNTTSINFPLLGAFQLNNSGNGDAFVSKFNPSGALQWSTYFGGSDKEWGYAVAMNSLNETFITGTTASSNLPGTLGNFQVAKSGGNDFYIAKLSAAGALSWATYYGGNANEYSYAIAINNNDVLITGYTYSSNFPVLTPYQNFNAGGMDAFIVRFSNTGVRQWATYMGGSSDDIGNGITVDLSGNIIYSGRTGSSNFPVLNAIQPARSGANDIFITKFTSAGGLVWSTFYGGSLNEEAGGIDHDNNGNVVVCGYTASANFPATPGAYQTSLRGGLFDNIIIKINSAGTLAWATFFGGPGLEEGSCIAIDSYNCIYVTGDSYGGIPTTPCSYQSQMGGDEDSFLSKFSPNGDLICSGYVGGPGHDEMHAKSTIAEYNGLVYLTGSTSGSYPVTPGAFQTQHAGGTGTPATMTDAFVAVVCGNACGEKMNLVLDFAASQQVICTGQSVSFTSSGSLCDTTGTRYEWYFTGGTPSFSSLQNPSAIIYNTSGVYPVKLIIRTPCGDDSLTKNAYITVNGPTVQLTQTNNIRCNGFNNGSIIAQAQGGTGIYYYQWLPSGGTSATASNLSAGTYTIIVNDGTGCNASASATITEPPLLQVFIPVQTNQTCFGGSSGSAVATVLGGVLPYNYIWSSIPAQITSTLTNIPSGTYSVIVTDANGCTANASVVITEPPQLAVIAIQQSPVKCNGGNDGTAISNVNGGTPAYLYSWSNGQTTSSASNLTAGAYSITVTDNFGCTSSAAINISEPATLTLSLTATPDYCLQSNGSVTTNSSGGTPLYTYSWSTGNTAQGISNLSQGIYSVTVTDNNGCSISASGNVNNVSGVNKQVLSTSQPLCNNGCDGTATINGAGGNPPYNYLWNTIPAQNTATATGLCAGIYTATITDSNNCKDTLQVNISQPSMVTATVTADSVSCFGANDGTATIAVSGGNPNYTYTWSNNATGASQNSLQAGVYTLTISDANSCTYVTQANILSPSSLTINTSPATTICNGQNLQLTSAGNGGTPNYSYLWSTGQNTSSITLQPTINSAYSLTVTDKNGCTAVTTTSVNVNALPVINFNADKISGCEPLCVTFINQTPNTSLLVWNFGDGTPMNANSPAQHCYNNPGSYHVSLLVTDNNGCSNSLVQNNYITVHPDPSANFSASPQTATILNPTVHFKDLSSGATSWTWSLGDISNPTSSQQHPQHTYRDTGTFVVTLIVTNEFGCIDTITDVIEILQDYIAYIPNTFTPNGDNKNEIFLPILAGINPEQYELLIFDRWGIEIFRSDNPAIGWNGKYKGSNECVQIDTYVWKLNVRDIYRKSHSYTGHVNVIR